ncbi:MAG: diacylglycerol/lipid kinase family protein [Gemmatimonadales bacterium]
MRASQPNLESAASRQVLLVNPFAGRVRRAAIARVVERVGIDGNAVLEIGRDGSAHQLAARLARRGVRQVLVAGGDGTWHHVVQALAGTRTALGLIPLGTSNDLAYRLQIPHDLDRALDVLADARIASVDLLKMGNHRVATVGGVGVPAHVAAACSHLKARPWLRRPAQALGGALYSMAAAHRIARYGAQATVCTTRANHGTPVTQTVSAILLGTVPRFGGGLQLYTGVPLRAGMFWALIVTASSRAALIDTLLRLKAGRSCDGHARQYSNLTSFTLHTGTALGAFGDGEWLGFHRRAVIHLERGALRALVPPSFSAAAAVASPPIVRREAS